MSTGTDGFQKSGKSKSNSNSIKVRSFDEQIDEARNAIRGSELLQSLHQSLTPFQVTHVRCLALGNFHQDFPARFQLALLLELLDLLKVSRCSFYDPVFDDEDLAYINGNGSWSVDESSPFLDVNPSQIMFFLPHAPLDLTEKVIAEESPKVWLANHLLQHTDRLTKVQLYDKYPLLCKLVNYINSNTATKIRSATDTDEDGFQTFTSSRKRKSKARNKFKETVIEYDVIESYFNDCKIINDFENGSLLANKIWLNSFSDLALHVIASHTVNSNEQQVPLAASTDSS